MRLARTIEKSDAPRPMSVPEAKKDISPIEARQVDTPEMENVLEEYPAQLEAQNLETFNWDNSATRLQLRQLYFLGPDGQPVPDAANYNKPMTKGKGTMAELMDQLFERAKAQQATLNNTRAALSEVRGKLETMVAEYNKLKPDARLLKMTEDELKQKINQLGQEKQTLEEQVAKLKSRVEEQAGEHVSLPEEEEGEKLTWYRKEESQGGWLVLIPVCLMLYLPFRAGSRRREQLKKREKELLLDYPELVSRFTVLLQAGISVRNIWERIVKEYEKRIMQGEPTRYVYEEMRFTWKQLENGRYESRAYGEFGRRCGLYVYMKFGALLEQNLKQGTTKLALRLKEESEEAFEERKNLARRLGEEAETKLMLPMFLMLFVVLAAVMTPAFLSF